MSDIKHKKQIKCWSLIWKLNISDRSLTDLYDDSDFEKDSTLQQNSDSKDTLVFDILINSGSVDNIESNLLQRQLDYLKLFEFDAKKRKKIESKFEETFYRILGAYVIAFYEEFSEGEIEKLARISNITELTSYINSNVRYQRKIDSVLEKEVEHLFLEIEDKKAQ